MKIQLVVMVEVSDETAALVNRSTVGGIGGMAVNIVRTALNDGTFKRVTVDVAEGHQNDADEITSAPAAQTPNRPRSAVSIPRAPVQSETGRTGRPKTLHNLEASDGGPVREWGQRSPEALQEAGIEVWEVQGDGTPPAPVQPAKSPAAHIQQNSKNRTPATAVKHAVKVRNR